MSSEKDPEKKFNSIMEKLLNVSKPNSPSDPSSSSSKKRPNPNVTDFSVLRSNKKIHPLHGNGFRNSSRSDITTTPQCRPWDRSDFIKRLATFKSMTWFGKPKVVDAVNCARRGWINVDSDCIACESCEARLLFSTPVSWSQQQVEKAALVFSLKLNNGHKTSCPWVDNSCDEKLAQFPLMTDQELVDGYKQRLLALSELVSLPMISNYAISHLKSSELEHFLENESSLENDDKLAEELRTAHLGNGIDAESAKKYYEAQKIISLCGWEPRSLSYVVDCENQSATKPIADTLLNFSESNGGHEICLCSKSNLQDTTETEDGFHASRGLKIDPNSSVLDCKLCGATVGLWAFAKIPRPLEFHRFVGYSDVNGEKGSEVIVPPNGKKDKKVGSLNEEYSATGCGLSSKDHQTNLNLTIAGGPPPTKQSFRAKISIPAIGHGIRARLFSDLALGSPEPPSQEQTESDPGKQQDQTHSLVECQSSVTTNPHEIRATFEPHDSTTMVGDESLSVFPNPSANEYVREKDVANEPSINGTSLKQVPDEKTMDFDPLRQHRHFCPWIASNSRSSPGWKLVLSALLRQNGSYLSPSTENTSSSKFIEVDDPISSIRRLFASPSPKRRKQMPGST